MKSAFKLDTIHQLRWTMLNLDYVGIYFTMLVLFLDWLQQAYQIPI